MTELRILTVRQPWAWAIIHGGKDVENRVRNIAGAYRGAIAIHVGKAYSTGWQSDALAQVMNDHPGVHEEPQPWRGNQGAIIGVVDIVGVHESGLQGCGTGESEGPIPLCSEWADPIAHHLVLANPRPLAEPIPYKGALGLRRLDVETTAGVWKQIGGTDD